MHFSLITWFMFPELVLELKVNLFSLTLCVLLPGGETVPQHSTIKEKKTIRRWNISKRLQTTEGNQVLSPIRAGHDGKRLLNDIGSLQKIQFGHLSCPSFFWFTNECCPVGFKGKKKSLFELPKHWIVLVLYIFILILFYFFVPWTLIGQSLIEGSLIVEKQHPTALLHPRVDVLCHKDNILTQRLILRCWRSI